MRFLDTPTVVLAAALLVTPLTLEAQRRDAAQPPLSACTYAECALRVEPGRMFAGPVLVRGTSGHRVARFGQLGPDLPRIVAGVDSAVAHARAFRPLQRRAGLAGAVAGASALTAAILGMASDANDTVPFSIAAGVFGAYAGFEAKRATRELSRAVWWYNSAIPR